MKLIKPIALAVIAASGTSAGHLSSNQAPRNLRVADLQTTAATVSPMIEHGSQSNPNVSLFEREHLEIVSNNQTNQNNFSNLKFDDFLDDQVDSFSPLNATEYLDQAIETLDLIKLGLGNSCDYDMLENRNHDDLIVFLQELKQNLDDSMIQKTEGLNATQNDEISEKYQLFQEKYEMLLEKIEGDSIFEDSCEISMYQYPMFLGFAFSVGMSLGLMFSSKNFKKHFLFSRQQDTPVAQIVDPEELEHGIEMVEIQES